VELLVLGLHAVCSLNFSQNLTQFLSGMIFPMGLQLQAFNQLELRVFIITLSFYLLLILH